MALKAVWALGLAKTITTMTTMIQKKPAGSIHYPCPDGASAALAAHLFFSAASILVMFFPNTVSEEFGGGGHGKASSFKAKLSAILARFA